MAATGQFEKTIKKKESYVLIGNGEKCDRKWIRSSKMAGSGHFVENKIKKIKVEILIEYWSEMVRNAIKSDIRA